MKPQWTSDYLKNSIIIFDEGHVIKPKYKWLIIQTILLEYDVIKMSATLEGRGFSLTSSYKIHTKHIKRFTEKMDDNFAKKKTLLFLKSTEDRFEKKKGGAKTQVLFKGLTKEQKKMLEESGIPYVILDKNYESSAVGIVEGMPEGCLVIANDDYEMGYTFPIGIVISKNETEIARLLPSWNYGVPTTQPLPFASMQQQRGRVGRIDEGIAYFLSTETSDDITSTDIASALIRILLTKDLDDLDDLRKIRNLDELFRYDIERIKEAVAFPDHFGKEPEEIIVGWNDSMPGYIAFRDYSKPRINVDEDLWRRYVGSKKEVKINKVSAKGILKLMIFNYLKKQKEFPRKVNVVFDNDLIKLTELEESEVHEVLNTRIKNELRGIFKRFNADYDKNKTKVKFKEENVRDEIAALHELAEKVEITINYEWEKPSKGRLSVEKVAKLKIFYEAPVKEIDF